MRTATSNSAAVERYLALYKEFERAGRQASEPAWLHGLRTAAIERFSQSGFPTTRDEEWRQTDVSPVVNFDGAVATTYHLNGLAPDGVNRFTPAELSGSRLVFVNGLYAPELSRLAPLPDGVTVGSLAEAMSSENPLVREHLGRYADFASHAFTAINTAFMRDGAFIHVPRNVVVEEPVHLLFLTTSDATVAHPRNLVVVEESAQVTLIESYAGQPEETYFTNAVTEIVAGPGAVIDHYKVQTESEAAFHIATLQVQQARDCNFRSLSVALGGRLARTESNAVLGGPGIECTLNGLYLAAGRQLIDNHTVMDHAEPHCASHELYAGILDGQARGVFNGKIFVRPDAQKTDAKQSNRSLLLSNDALINTKPQLEIFADDVKCTHGATIGQLDEDAIFYLRARGIDEATARDMLVHAFASDILNRVQVEPLRAQLDQEINARLARGRSV